MRYVFASLLFLVACGSQVVEFPLDEGFGNPPPVDVDAGDADSDVDTGTPSGPTDAGPGSDGTVPGTDSGTTPGTDSGSSNGDSGTSANDGGPSTDGGNGSGNDGGNCHVCQPDSGPPACVPKTKRQACGDKRCVKVSDGCGGKVFCGDERACNACNKEYECCTDRCESKNQCEDDTKRCKRQCGEELACCYSNVRL
jgi:hypothetical protein